MMPLFFTHLCLLKYLLIWKKKLVYDAGCSYAQYRPNWYDYFLH